MKDLQLFKFKGQDVRVVWSECKNDWYYVLVDTCRILEIGNPSDVVKRLLFKDGVDSIEVIDSLGRKQKTTCVSLPNYSDLISRSDTAPALAFRQWVWGEVIPAILQTGSYSINGINFQDYEQIGHLDLQNDPELLRQAVEFYEDLMHAGSKKKTFVTYLHLEGGGFYAVARVGSVRPESCFCPSTRMLIAALVSLSSSHPHSQECQRSERSFLRMVPHPEQAWLV